MPTRPGSTLRSQTIKQEPHLLSSIERAKRRALAAREKRRTEGSFLPESFHRFFEPTGMPSDKPQPLTSRPPLPTEGLGAGAVRAGVGPQPLTSRPPLPTEGLGAGAVRAGEALTPVGLGGSLPPNKAPQQLRTDNMGAVTEQDVGQYLAQNPLSQDPRAPVNLSDANFQQAGLYDQNAYLQQARQDSGQRQIQNPMDIETGFDPSNLPGGAFGAQLGYLKALSSLIGPAAMGKARRRQEKQLAAQRQGRLKTLSARQQQREKNMLEAMKLDQPQLTTIKGINPETGAPTDQSMLVNLRTGMMTRPMTAEQQQQRIAADMEADRKLREIKNPEERQAILEQINAARQQIGMEPFGGGQMMQGGGGGGQMMQGGGGGGGQQLQTTAPQMSINQAPQQALPRPQGNITAQLTQEGQPTPEQVNQMIQGLLYQPPAMERQQGAMIRPQVRAQQPTWPEMERLQTMQRQGNIPRHLWHPRPGPIDEKKMKEERG